ncbi:MULTISPECIES: prepilin-type N-terminal cleavage/methylation domain-containing protein [Pseudomonas]|uniref:Prepilin-type N-terminal cleavage/methylation domain-containing protein n=1 Tax=Pseudomonas vlassakiae TaxID=485888 RepID=A0A923GPJ2_9PSED|nr:MULTISPECIES: prepilin-type N-terminal cleavage/methylation domain-containing protein [Pseudomonas]MBH3414057.1 prepilin-type N-terminal cleavage/methylation domain-containing protein [Pseudomonas putida]MBV4544055.1 prepilin-type N-terminal cleavage/methylation domain-containing protein [Pseudomonas vlassakiae]
MPNKQWGMTLIEVLLAVLVVAVGMFAAAGLQLKALQATDSARRDAQAVLAQYSEQERSPR